MVLLLSLAIFCKMSPILYLPGVFHPQLAMKVKLDHDPSSPGILIKLPKQ